MFGPTRAVLVLGALASVLTLTGCGRTVECGEGLNCFGEGSTIGTSMDEVGESSTPPDMPEGESAGSSSESESAETTTETETESTTETETTSESTETESTETDATDTTESTETDSTTDTSDTETETDTSGDTETTSGDTETTTDEEGTTDTTTGGSFCGDGIIDPGEQCDGDELQGLSCVDLGYVGGTLLCDPVTCTFDASMCDTGGGGTTG